MKQCCFMLSPFHHDSIAASLFTFFTLIPAVDLHIAPITTTSVWTVLVFSTWNILTLKGLDLKQMPQINRVKKPRNPTTRNNVVASIEACTYPKAIEAKSKSAWIFQKYQYEKKKKSKMRCDGISMGLVLVKMTPFSISL